MRIYWSPQLYRTVGAGCEHMRFVLCDMKAGPFGMMQWVRVERLWGPLYRSRGTVFYDWPVMFIPVEGKP